MLVFPGREAVCLSIALKDFVFFLIQVLLQVLFQGFLRVFVGFVKILYIFLGLEVFLLPLSWTAELPEKARSTISICLVLVPHYQVDTGCLGDIPYFILKELQF